MNTAKCASLQFYESISCYQMHAGSDCLNAVTFLTLVERRHQVKTTCKCAHLTPLAVDEMREELFVHVVSRGEVAGFARPANQLR
jgi:hypothetical protein